jgi:eukaryotic-like serine/threonine-protein kinase
MVGLSNQVQSHVGQLTDHGGPFPTRIFGYDVVDRLGFGAASAIYVVTDPTTRQLRALKHVIRKTDKDARFIDQLVNEYEVAKKINHPTLRRVVDMKMEKTLLRKVLSAALVMEMFDGAPLTQLNFIDAADVFAHTADALSAMHRMGYVHCDLKPANILRGRGGEVRVIDLGQACPVGTIKERIQGTPDFIAPEQVKREAVDPRTDVYNFGATLYSVLTGEKIPTLFNVDRGENSFVTDALVKTPAEICPVIPESLSQLVMECVRISPSKRPQDISQVGQRLRIISSKFGGK